MIEEVKKLIVDLLAKMDVQATVDYEESATKGHVFNIAAHDSYLLIGRQGTHLQALQLIVQQLVIKQLKPEQPFYFMLDVDDYKRKREWYLKETAKQAVEHIKRVGKNVILEPMPNYERRLIHAYLQESFPDVTSESTGDDPHRRIIIKLKT